MNLQDLASIAEIIGGIAVLVTLIYLAIELRDNTRTLKAKETTASYIGWSEFNITMSMHPDRAVWLRAFDPTESYENFNTDDLAALDFIGRAMVQRFGAGSFQYHAGLLSGEAWTPQITFCQSALRLPVWREWWEIEEKNPIYAKTFLSDIHSAPSASIKLAGVVSHHGE